jgi:hypothetical protein
MVELYPYYIITSRTSLPLSVLGSFYMLLGVRKYEFDLM